MQLGEDNRERPGPEGRASDLSGLVARTANPSGNARLTAITGAALLILFSA